MEKVIAVAVAAPFIAVGTWCFALAAWELFGLDEWWWDRQNTRKGKG